MKMTKSQRSCKYCPRKFRDLTILNCHMKYAHENSAKVEPKEPENDTKKQISKETNTKKNRGRPRKTAAIENEYKCNQCQKVFGSSKMLTHHMTFVHKNLEKCPLCHLKIRHITAHKNQSHDYDCDHCDLKFVTHFALLNHLKTNHKNKKNKCKHCHKIFASNCASKFVTHLKTHQNETNNNKVLKITSDKDDKSCKICHKNMDINGFGLCLKCMIKVTPIIILKKNDTNINKCDACNIFFDNPNNFVSHFEAEHVSHSDIIDKNEDILTKSDILLSALMTANVEKDDFLEPQLMKNEVKRASKLKYSCDFCTKKFTRLEIKAKHLQSCHPKSSTIIEKYKKIRKQPHRIQCRICFKFKWSKSALRNHVKFCHLKIIECHKCDMKLKNLQSFVNHKKNYHQQETEEFVKVDENVTFFSIQKCDICHSYFQDKLTLENHMKNQHGNQQTVIKSEKPYKCHICDTSYALTSSLKRHMKTVHEIQEPSAATDKGSLEFKQEMKQETAPLVFKKEPQMMQILTCTFCAYSSFNQQDIANHMLSAHISVQNVIIQIPDDE